MIAEPDVGEKKKEGTEQEKMMMRIVHFKYASGLVQTMLVELTMTMTMTMAMAIALHEIRKSWQ